MAASSTRAGNSCGHDGADGAGGHCETCAAPCPLSRLPAGVRAIVVQFLCPQQDARHLRVLGVFEGTAVTIVDDRAGVVLDVRGTRVAIGASLAAMIVGLRLT